MAKKAVDCPSESQIQVSCLLLTVSVSVNFGNSQGFNSVICQMVMLKPIYTIVSVLELSILTDAWETNSELFIPCSDL